MPLPAALLPWAERLFGSSGTNALPDSAPEALFLVGSSSIVRYLWLLHMLGLPLSTCSTISQTPYNVGEFTVSDDGLTVVRNRRGAEGADLGR